MAVGTYGTIRPADVSPEDVEIILNYTPSRDQTTDFVLKTLDAPSILRPYFNNTNTGGNAGIEVLGGLYNLTLPAEEFNQIGIYTLMIRPAQIRTTISDCGVLSALPNVKGIVIDLSNVPEISLLLLIITFSSFLFFISMKSDGGIISENISLPVYVLDFGNFPLK